MKIPSQRGRNKISKDEEANWTEQLRILNNISDLITPQLSIEEIIAAIYENVNQLIDAYRRVIILWRRVPPYTKLGKGDTA